MPLNKGFSPSVSRASRQPIHQSVSDIKSTFLANVESQQAVRQSSIRGGESGSYKATSVTTSGYGVAEVRRTGTHISLSSSFHPKAVNPPSNHSIHISDMARSGNTYPEGVDDDNILEVPDFHCLL